MITRWQRSTSGGHVVLRLRADLESGAIHIRDHLPGRPTLASLLGPVIATGAKVDGPRLITTLEGELGAIVNVVDGSRQVTTAVVFGDDQYAIIEAISTLPAQHALYQETTSGLAHRHELGLGRDRTRRFLYEPPAGWTGVSRGRETLWISPANPRRFELVRVYDARPLRSRGRLHDELAEAPRSSRNFRTRDGLPGDIATWTDTMPERDRVIISLATVRDDAYTYRFRLECDEASFKDASRVFGAMVLTTRPLVARRGDSDVFAAWQD
jgi:hypothetical protein